MLTALMLATPLSAQARQEPAEVKKAIEEFLRVQTKGLPGQVSFTVNTIDPNNNLAPCPALEVFLPANARPWGRTNVGVRCQVEGSWSIYVSVQVKVISEYYVTAKPLSRGQLILQTDLAKRTGDLAELPAGVVTDGAQAIGRTLTIGMQSGQMLRSDNLLAQLAVQQNQNVKLISKGKGFQVASDGRALNNASDGQVVQVRSSSGQTLSGIARPGGVVEITY